MGWPNPQKGRVKPALLQPRAGMGMLRCRGVVSGELLQQALSHPFRLAPCKRSPPSSRHLFFWGHLGTAAVSGRGAAEAVPGQPGFFCLPFPVPWRAGWKRVVRRSYFWPREGLGEFQRIRPLPSLRPLLLPRSHPAFARGWFSLSPLQLTSKLFKAILGLFPALGPALGARSHAGRAEGLLAGYPCSPQPSLSGGSTGGL